VCIAYFCNSSEEQKASKTELIVVTLLLLQTILSVIYHEGVFTVLYPVYIPIFVAFIYQFLKFVEFVTENE